MARIWSSGFESNSKLTGVEFDNFSTTPTSIVTSPVHGGGMYSARANPVATTAQIRKNLSATNQATTGYLRIYFYIAAVPDVNTEIVRWVSTSGSNVARLQLTPTGTLVLLTASSTVIGSPSAPLGVNRWYRVEMMNDATTTPGTLEARIDGVQIAVGANSVQGSWGRIDLGVAVASTCDVYFDDMAVNDASGTHQNSWPGPGSIVHLHPNAAGDSNTFSVTSGGVAGTSNNYTRVSEVATDDSASYNGSLTLGQEDLFNCEDSSIGASDVVSVVSVGVRFVNGVTADPVAAVTLEIEKTVSGTKALSSPIIPNNSTNWRTNAPLSPYLYPITTYVDPDGAAWTQSTIASSQIGYKLTAAGTSQVRVSTVWTLVEYNPASSGGFQNGAFFALFN